MNRLKGNELLKFESVQKWISSLDHMSIQRGKDGLLKMLRQCDLAGCGNTPMKVPFMI